jgi:hypothetical protein
MQHALHQVGTINHTWGIVGWARKVQNFTLQAVQVCRMQYTRLAPSSTLGESLDGPGRFRTSYCMKKTVHSTVWRTSDEHHPAHSGRLWLGPEGSAPHTASSTNLQHAVHQVGAIKHTR